MAANFIDGKRCEMERKDQAAGTDCAGWKM